jgi:autotransporter-associated beta strand protein
VSFATSTVGNVTVADGKTVTVTQGGVLTNSPLIATYDIGDGATLTWTNQNTSNSTAAGFIKNGNGTWNRGTGGDSNSNASGGFTLNAGTVIVSGARGLGNGSLTINGGTIQSNGGHTFSVTGLTVGGNFDLTGAGNDIFTAPITLGNATRVITNNTSGNRTFNGATTGGSTTDMYLVVGGSGNTTLNGTISDGTAGGTLGLVKTGSGRLAIGVTNVSNSFTGGISIESGTFQIFGSGGSQLGSNAITLGSSTGGDTRFEVSTNFSPTYNLFKVSQGTGNRTLAMVSDSTTTLNWRVILEKDLTVTSNQGTKGIILASEFIGGSDLVFTYTGAGTPSHSIRNPTYSGSNSYTTRNLFTGNMVISNGSYLEFGSNPTNLSSAPINILAGGTFRLRENSLIGGLNGAATGNVIATQNSKTLTIAGNGNYVFSGSLLTGANTGAGLTIRMNKEGLQGTQTLAGNNTFAGATALEAGTLRLDYSAANGSKLANSGILTLRGINLDLSGGSHTEVVASTTLATGFNTISRSSGSSVLALGALTNTSGGINFSADNIATTTLANTNNILGGKAVFTVAGQDWARNDGSNNIVAFSAGNYTAMSSTINLTTNNFNHYLATGNVTVDPGANLYVGTIKIDPSGANQSFRTTNLAQNLNFGNGTGGAGGILFTGSHDYSFLDDGNGIVWNETNVFNYSSGNLTLGRFNNALRFFGNGTTILAQNSSSNSTMYIYGGTVRFSANNANSGGNYELFGGSLLADTSGGDISLVRGNGTARTISLGYNAPRIDVIGGNTLTINGVISTAGGASFFSPVVFGSSAASGTIVLGGTNTFYGDVRLEGATLSVGADAQLGDVGNMLVFGGNATFKTTGSFTANRAVAINSGYTGTFSPNAGTTFTLSQPIRGAGNLEMNGAGTLILSGSSLYTGATKISQGILSITSVDATAKSSGIQISGGAGLTYSGGAATLGQNITVTSSTGYLRNSGGGLLTLGGNISKNGTTLRLSEGSFAVTGEITGSAANSDIYLESGGTITFTGTNTYNGPTYILNGTTLNANSAGALSASSNLIMDDSGSGSSVLNLGANQTTGSIAGAASSAINLGSHTLTSNSASSTTFAGGISGDGGLTKAGVGTLSITGSNTYNGSTAITGGTLSLGTGGTAGSLGSGNISISSGAALVANRSNDLTLANAISGAGDILQTGSGNTTLSGTNNNTGAVRATAGQLLFDGASALSTGISLLEVDNATLSLADGTARTSNLASASLVADTGTFVFDIAASASDMLVFGGSATLAGTRTINLNFLETLSSGQSWVLMNATGGGLGGNWTLGTTSGAGQSGFTFSLSATSNELTLTAATSGSTYYWKGDLDANWGTTSGGDSNWASDSSGASLRSNAPSSGSDVIFAATGAGNLSTTLGADRTIESLTVSVGGVEINGANTLTMQSSSATGILVNAASGTVTIGATLAGASTGLTKEGASLLGLTGNNTYGGGTTLSGGTLRIGSDAALGNSTAAITLSGDAVLQASGNLTFGASRPVVVSGNGSLDTQSHTITVAGVLDGAGTLQKTGAGSLVLNSANTLSGTLSPAAGTLILANQNALSSATLSMGGGNLSFSSSVGGNAFTLGGLSAASSGTGYDIQLQNTAGQAIALSVGSSNASTTYAAALGGNGSLLKAGSGLLTLSGNNTYTGTTTLNAGTLAVTGSLSATPSVTINSGTLSLDSNNAVSSTTTITLANASGTAFNVTANQTIGGLRGGGIGNGTTSISASQTLVVQESGTQSYNGTITGAGGFHFNGSGTLTLGGVVSNTGGITISSGNLTITSANTYTGGTTLAGGVLNINSATSLSSGILTITGGTLANTSGGNVTLGSNNQFWNGDFGYAGADTLNLGTGQVTLGASRTLDVQSGNLAVSGAIAGVGLGITKTGGGTLQLLGANTFTGPVSINGGTIVVSGGSAIVDSVAVTLADTAGTRFLINSNEGIGSLIGGGTNGGEVLISSGAVLRVGETGNQTFGGLITGSGTFEKDGAGTLTLTNSNSTISSRVSILRGTLAVESVGMSGVASALGTNATILLGGNGNNKGTLRWFGIGSETTQEYLH